MVNKHIVANEVFYSCEICGLVYNSMEYAKRCEEYCKQHPGTCSLEISKYAVGYVVRENNGLSKIVFYKLFSFK